MKKLFIGVLIILSLCVCLGCSKMEQKPEEGKASDANEGSETVSVKGYPDDINVADLPEWERDTEATSYEAVWHCPYCKQDDHLFGVEAPRGGHVKCQNCGKWLRYPGSYQKRYEELNK